MRIVALAILALSTAALCGPIPGQDRTAGRKPNILLIVADDMGWGDMGCTGSEHLRTPHLDALAESGVLCTRAYVSSPVCSPSRAGLITGRDPRRFGYQANLNMAARRYATRPELLGLPLTERTLADHLKATGYATGIVGKWHLGGGELFHPNRRGFDHFCGMLGGGHDYFVDPDKSKIERNGEPVRDYSSDYLTDFFTDEAERFVRGQQDKARDNAPWFLYLSYNAPHTPMHATDEDRARFAHIEHGRRRIYAAMMWALDRGVGRMVALLDELGIREDTLVVFVSDNGGATNNGSWNGPLSGAKGSLREGGLRVPMIWSWPGHIPAEQRWDGVASTLDLLPTFVAAAGSEVLELPDPPSHEDKRNRRRMREKYGDYDGIDLLPALENGEELPERTLFFRLQGQAAVLRGAQKLIRLPHRPAQLFDVATDLGERSDLIRVEQDAASERFRLLAEWESLLPTVPLWGSSPYWSGNSARIYDTWAPRPEPR